MPTSPEQQTVIATITDVGFEKPHKTVRAACTLRMFEPVATRGYPVVTVDASSPPDYAQHMRDLGVHVIPQDQPGKVTFLPAPE